MPWLVSLGLLLALLSAGYWLYRQGKKLKAAQSKNEWLARDLKAAWQSAASCRAALAGKDKELENLRKLVPADQLFDSVFGGVPKAGTDSDS